MRTVFLAIVKRNLTIRGRKFRMNQSIKVNRSNKSDQVRLVERLPKDTLCIIMKVWAKLIYLFFFYHINGSGLSCSHEQMVI